MREVLRARIIAAVIKIRILGRWSLILYMEARMLMLLHIRPDSMLNEDD